MLLLLPAGRRAGVQAQPAGLTHAIRPHVPGRRQRQRMPQPRLVLGWTGTDSRQGARQRQRMPQSRLVPRPRHGMARGMHRHHDLFNAVRTTRTCGRMGMPRTRHGMGGREGWQDPGPAHSGRPGRSGRNPQAGRQARRIQAGRAGAEGTRRQAGRQARRIQAGRAGAEGTRRQAGRQARCRVRHERPCPNRVLSDQRASGRLPIP